MFRNITEVKRTARPNALFWRRIAFPLLIALLALGFVGVSPGVASSSAPRHPATVSSQQADAAPAIEEYNGIRYVGWTGRNPAHNLNLMAYDPATKSFSQAQVLTDTTFVGSGPSLANFYGNLYVAWLGTDYRLNVGRYNLANPSVLANKVTLNEFSLNAPTLAGFNGHLYLSWRGLDGRLNIISSLDGSTFSSKVTYDITVRTTPSLVGANFYLLVFWEDMSASSHIVVGRYDPAQPASLSAVVTLTATSQLPVGVALGGVPAPYARVAWCSASGAHIRLGLFEGDSVLHNVVTTAETSPYAPALFDGASMSWTGTDMAQRVNVSQINF